MIIRKATKKDIPILLRYMIDLQKFEHNLSNRVRSDYKTKSFFKNEFLNKRITNSSFVFLIAWEDNNAVGMISGWKEYVSYAYKNEYVGYICQLIINPEFRGKGIGKKLVERISEEFRKMGLNELKIEVLHNNIKTINFWKTLGFKDMYKQMRKDI